MSAVGSKEYITQKRIIDLFKNHLGYDYLGNWETRENNRNIEHELLQPFLKKQGCSDNLTQRALHQLDRAAIVGGGISLYDANKEVYNLLRYGVKIKEDAGAQTQTVWLIDWKNPEKNHFAIAEEVTVINKKTKRPDLVIYINGIAIGVIELKRSIVALNKGIRQNLLNQKEGYIRPFFSTMQLVMAGNDTQGLRYGTIETTEKHYLEWKEDGGQGNDKPDQHLLLLFEKARVLELIHNFIVFDAGTKKICRHNQYFGIKAAQDYIRRRQGGIIWHTQGSGKSLTMVWLAKWIQENIPDSRVLVITDRTELDQQIEQVYSGVEAQIYRTVSVADLLYTLNRTQWPLICSLVHKFGGTDDDESPEQGIDTFAGAIRKHKMPDFQAKGDIYVFVDECHRTQSGKLHAAMKEILPNALFIGFTGTPLLKSDKQRSLEVFGPYIHTYKFDEAINDGVVLGLRYEARNIDQNLTSQEKIDQWFDAKTKGLNDYAQMKLKQRWGTMQKVLSSQSRLEKIVADILLDMETRDRLMNGRGNAILVSGSIYQACKLYELFSRTDLAKKCAIVTSYRPNAQDVKDEESGEGETEKLQQYEIYSKMLVDFFGVPKEQAVNRVEEFEQEVKKKFIKEPGQMRLLIVVDKLLTGFDAPPATYLYIDKSMQDHGLFQAICRVNRLDGEDKEYGYIVDYKDLFRSLEESIKDYISGAFDKYDKEDVAGLLGDRLEKAKERLDETREAIKARCENVDVPKDTPAYIRYFCGADASDKDALKVQEERRLALYKETSSYIRAYAALAGEMEKAGYSLEEINATKTEVGHYEKVRTEIQMASGDYIDLKSYEPAMRHLIDNYIKAEESETISAFDDLNLIELIVKQGEEAVKKLPQDIRNDEQAIAETIENNIRKIIINKNPINPVYYEKMSELLASLIKERKEEAREYKHYLEKIIELSKQVCHPETSDSYPSSLKTTALRSLYDSLGENAELAIKVNDAIEMVRKDDWRGNMMKEREIISAINDTLSGTGFDVDTIFDLAKNQNEY